jgi:hypothetical protein
VPYNKRAAAEEEQLESSIQNSEMLRRRKLLSVKT